MTDDKRVDDLREDVQELRREMHSGFASLEEKIKDSRIDLTKQNVSSHKNRDEEIEKIHCLIKDQDDKITLIDKKHTDNYNNLHDLFSGKFNELDKKLFKLFFVGNIIGMAAGSLITLALQVIVRQF